MILLILPLAFIATGCKKGDEPGTPGQQAQSLASRAASLMIECKYPEALSLYEKASELRPSCAQYHVGVARAGIRLNDHHTARTRYEKALAILQQQSRQGPERVDDLLMVLICLNRDQEAKQVLDKAGERFANNPTIELIAENYAAIIEGFDEYRIKE